MPRPLLPLAALLAVAAPARAQSPACEARSHTRVGAARWNGYGDSHDVRLQELRGGGDLWVSRSLGLAAEGTVVRATGRRDGRDVAATGVGGVGLLAWRPLCTARWSLQLTHGYGVVRFGDAFPPGGTRWNGMLQFGVDATVALAPRVALAGGVRHFHVSNGRGLVDDNPAFNGLGGWAGLSLRLREDGATPWPAREAATPDTTPAARVRLLQLDATVGNQSTSYSTGGAGNVTWLGAGARADVGLAHAARLQLDVVAGAYRDAGRLTTVAVAPYLRDARGLVGISASRTAFEGFRTDQLLLVGELYPDALLTVAGAAGVELRNAGDDVFVGELFLRAYVTPDLMLSSGVSWARASLKQTDADLLYRAEWQPLDRLSLFAERRNKDQKSAAGVRVYPGRVRALRERHREEMLVGVR